MTRHAPPTTRSVNRLEYRAWTLPETTPQPPHHAVSARARAVSTSSFSRRSRRSTMSGERCGRRTSPTSRKHGDHDRERPAAVGHKRLKITQSATEPYPAIVRLWNNAWAEFTPFLAFDPELRRIICSTNAIESVNARIRRAVKARGHFPNEQAALKCVYMSVMSLDPTGTGRNCWTMRWKPVLNVFVFVFVGCLVVG